MSFVVVDGDTIDQEHICCALGQDRANKARAQTKKDWMKKEFEHGLVFRKLDQRGKVFLESMPIETVWKPLVGANHLVINCLWVSGQFKGKGYAKALLEACVQDARDRGCDGVAVVTSSTAKPYLTDKKFYAAHGFATVDRAAPYFELMVYALHDGAEKPRFTDRARTNESSFKDGIEFVYANQCVFMEEYVPMLDAVARSEGRQTRVVKLLSGEHARACGSPFGTLGIYDRGKFLTHELMTAETFRARLQKGGA